MSDIITAAGSAIAIGDALPATYDASGYGAVTWEDVGEVTSLPAFGKTFQINTVNTLGARQTRKRKGTWDPGDLMIGILVVHEDDGQIDMLAALESDNPLPFRVTLNDATATLTVPTKYYFCGLVYQAPINPGSDPNGFVTAEFGLSIDTAIVKVARAAP